MLCKPLAAGQAGTDFLNIPGNSWTEGRRALAQNLLPAWQLKLQDMVKFLLGFIFLILMLKIFNN